jgi:hypothetical protein
MAQIEIKSRPGMFAIIPDEVAEAAKGYRWHINSYGYVLAWNNEIKPRKSIYLHHLVIYVMTGKWLEKGQEVDHLNHDKLDNSMENLHLGSKSDNLRNMKKREGASSEFQGVHWYTAGQKWIAKAGVRKDGKDCQIRSSYTPDIEIAKLCADCIRDLIGGWIPRNYPERTFLDKWKEIGEKQRRQIFRSMAKNNVPIYDNTIFIERKVA